MIRNIAISLFAAAILTGITFVIMGLFYLVWINTPDKILGIPQMKLLITSSSYFLSLFLCTYWYTKRDLDNRSMRQVFEDTPPESRRALIESMKSDPQVKAILRDAELFNEYDEST